MAQSDLVVDLAFPLRGDPIPVDHGEALYATVARRLLSMHQDARVGIHSIDGRYLGDRRLDVTERGRLVLRLPADRLPEAIRLAGEKLAVGGGAIRVGVPSVYGLLLHASLHSRLVVIKGFVEEAPFLDAARRQLVALGLGGEAGGAGTATLLRVP